MSHEAINEVTRALRVLLHSQLTPAVPNALVTMLPPGDQLKEVAGVNLYLYRVVESPFTRNRPWPGDQMTAASEDPALGLQLFYLLTPLGPRPDDNHPTVGDVAHTMLGLAMLTLHQHPVLNDIHIPTFDADTVLPPFLLNSFEKIKICLQPTNLEELSKIWASINRPYRLSVAYEVSLVELTPTAPPPVAGGIVTFTGVQVITLDPPRLTGLSRPGGPLVQVNAGFITANALRLTGFGLTFPGQTPTVQIGGQEVTITSLPTPIASPPMPGGEESMTVVLPTDLDAGPQVNVRATLNGHTSAPLTFTVDPWLKRIEPLRTALETTPTTMVLEGSGFTAAPRAVRFDAAVPGAAVPASVAPAPGATDARATVTIPPGLPNGMYDVRLVSDAAGSATNSRTLEVIPRVAVQLIPSSPPGGPGQILVTGARLQGGNIRLLIDGVTYEIGAQPNVNSFVYPLHRPLDPGMHSVAVNVDGHMSHAVDLEVV